MAFAAEPSQARGLPSGAGGQPPALQRLPLGARPLRGGKEREEERERRRRRRNGAGGAAVGG